MAKIKITEAQLRDIIAESVKQILNEKKENDYREIIGSNELFSFLDGIRGGAAATFGYITIAKDVDVPMVQRRNPDSNRMKNFPDWETFGKTISMDNVTGVIKITVYNQNWPNPETISAQSKEHFARLKSIRDKYGIETQKARWSSEKKDFGKGDTRTYGGENPELQKNTYTAFNIKALKPISTSYYVVSNGKPVLVDKSKLPMLPPEVKKDIIKLKDAGATPEEIASLRGFQWGTLKHSHFLFISATSNNEAKLFINDKLADDISSELQIEPNDLVQIAKDRYKDRYKLV